MREDIDKIYRMRDYFTTFARSYDYVPDPYYEGREGFYLVIEMLEEACEALLEEIINE
jgi:protein-tyrosine phosphatase